MFEIRNLRYKDILYIEKMNIRKGITTSITGRSGSGKTTLLKMLNKMISPDEGTILYEKKPVKNIDSLDLRRRVVMLPQSPVIFPGDIRDNLLKGLRFSEKPDAPDSRMNEIISELHLNKSLDDDISQLSGGEKQRIALARVRRSLYAVLPASSFSGRLFPLSRPCIPASGAKRRRGSAAK